MEKKMSESYHSGKLAKKRKFALVAMLLLAIIAAGSVTVTAIPQIPEYYWGYAILDGEPAPIGTEITVEVYGTGEVVGWYTTQYGGIYAGLYVMKVRIDDPGSEKDEGATNGEPLMWKINGIECSMPAPGTEKAESGGINNNFTIVASSPGITSATDTRIPENNAAKINGENISSNRLVNHERESEVYTATNVTPHPHRFEPIITGTRILLGYATLNDAINPIRFCSLFLCTVVVKVTECL